jgi:acetyl-CoA acetyltransferase
MDADVLRDKVAIVGVGTTSFGEMYAERDANRSAYNLAADAFRLALDDCGLPKSAVDGLLCFRVPSYAVMADMLGLRHLRLVNRIDGSGRMSGVGLANAAMAIATGLADTVACVYGNNGRSVRARYGGGEGSTPTASYDTVYGMTSPGAYVGMMYRHYMAEFGVPDGALAPLAINNRQNAAKNPIAVMRSPLSEEEYRSSRFISDPLRLYDYCLINDGAVALILTSADRARDLKKPPVRITATAACSDLTNFYTSTDYFGAASASVSRELYSAAGLGPEDVDLLEIYDNFTPTILFGLEGFGYCKPGTAWQWVTGGRIALDGEMPVNTSGGHTSESYMQGWALHAEAVRQLRHECGDRQVKDCHVAQYICPAPIVSSHILTRG